MKKPPVFAFLEPHVRFFGPRLQLCICSPVAVLLADGGQGLTLIETYPKLLRRAIQDCPAARSYRELMPMGMAA